MYNRPLSEVLSPDHMQDDFSRALVSSPDYGFVGAKRLDDGTYVGIKRLVTTIAICVGIDEISAYRRRYCYNDLKSCLAAYERICSGNEEPSGWIARRPEFH